MLQVLVIVYLCGYNYLHVPTDGRKTLMATDCNITRARSTEHLLLQEAKLDTRPQVHN